MGKIDEKIVKYIEKYIEWTNKIPINFTILSYFLIAHILYLLVFLSPLINELPWIIVFTFIISLVLYTGKLLKGL